MTFEHGCAGGIYIKGYMNIFEECVSENKLRDDKRLLTAAGSRSLFRPSDIDASNARVIYLL